MDALPDTRAAWFLEDGTPYAGGVFEDDKGKPFGEALVTCWKCGGSGRWRGRRKCFPCEGGGEIDEQVRLYTGPQLEKREQARLKRRAKADEAAALKKREIAARYLVFRDENAHLLERAEACKDDKFVGEMLAKAEIWGSLTCAQLDALGECLDRKDRIARIYADSKPVAQPGERVEIEVTCTGSAKWIQKKFKGRGREEMCLTDLLDAEGNALYAITPNFSMAEGERAVIKGTVKGYDERPGWPRTQLIRVAVVEVLPALSPEDMRVPAPSTDGIPFRVDADILADLAPAA
ncbi:hypothetical protein BHAOGJBA_1223 [Methylobacterium hispanicum]|uniref:DUF2314 domain-containing protein n=1 Tax=Methylobacterium hispanicum TaxID=270350 RepID=A0AAV4ZHR1_9HYPH|nr:hypothetical protein [Methylobacterium hispanicum]GJD87718.1 hypothetical protein BHAOGJBA_1223 [Methylobacterium hispanicum]